MVAEVTGWDWSPVLGVAWVRRNMPIYGDYMGFD
jgi:hypothetical protein